MNDSFNLDDINMNLSIGNLKLNVQSIKYGVFTMPIDSHIHSKITYELHYVPFGKGVLIANGKKYDIYENVLFMTGPDIVHEQRFDPYEPMAEFCIAFENLTLKNDTRCEIAEAFLSKNFWYGEDKENLAYLFQEIKKENEMRFIGYYENIKLCIEKIVIGLIRNYSDNKVCNTLVPLKTLDDKRISIIDEFFLWDCQNHTLKDLSQRLNLSERQTKRIIKKHYNLTFSKKRQITRMNKAISLLKGTNLPINKIAEKLGFSSLEHFSTSFKKYSGFTPTHFRNMEK